MLNNCHQISLLGQDVFREQRQWICGRCCEFLNFVPILCLGHTCWALKRSFTTSETRISVWSQYTANKVVKEQFLGWPGSCPKEPSQLRFADGSISASTPTIQQSGSQKGATPSLRLAQEPTAGPGKGTLNRYSNSQRALSMLERESSHREDRKIINLWHRYSVQPDIKRVYRNEFSISLNALISSPLPDLLRRAPAAFLADSKASLTRSFVDLSKHLRVL